MLLMREVNLRIFELTRDLDGETDYFCECGSARCRERTIIRLYSYEFAEVLATDDCFVVAFGHEPRGARVVWERAGYLVVAVTGFAER